MKHKETPLKFKRTKLFARYSTYTNGQNAIELYYVKDGDRYAVASVAIEIPLSNDEVAIKNYSENEGLLEMLIKAGIIATPHRFYKSAWVTIQICILLKKSHTENRWNIK